MSSDLKIQIGAVVIPTEGLRGTLVDVRPLPNGTTALGILSTNGRIEYHDAKFVRSAEGTVGAD